MWELDHADAEPFYAAIASQPDAFEEIIVVSVGGFEAGDISAMSATERLEAGPATALTRPADLLREIETLCHVPRRRLLMFDSLDQMAAVWGAQQARGFFARCCPLLLEAGAIAYWAMSAHEAPEVVRDTVRAVTQCILRVDQRSVRVSKAEGRGQEVAGSVLHWNARGGPSSLETASIHGRVAASLRYLRRTRQLSQHGLAQLAGVTSSAISQAERGERGLSLATVVRLSTALGITVDDLLRGEDPALYRIGRRADEPQRGTEHPVTLLGGLDSELRVDLVQLAPREAQAARHSQKGSGIVAVAAGLVQVEVGGQTPSVRQGEVLIADSERVDRWRNLGNDKALLFWIVLAQVTPPRPHRSLIRLSSDQR